jgi:molecular chaperone HscB
MSATDNYFTLFDLPAQFDVDLNLLDQHYRKIQTEVHPDKFVTASPAERLRSMQQATLANEAYQTLKQPTSRARYLLSLQGIATLEDSNTAMPTDFLMAQMEWREAMEDAKMANDVAALDTLLKEMKTAANSLQAQLALELTPQSELAALNLAAISVRKLSFIDKISADVNALISKLED